MPDDGGDKTHDPTPRRREQAREQGQVAKSQDLASALVLVLALILLWKVIGSWTIHRLVAYSQEMLGVPVLIANLSHDGLQNEMVALCYGTTIWFMTPLAVFFGAMLVGAVFVNIAQIGILWLPDKLGFDITRLDPIKGFGRIFSLQSVMRLVMGIVKVIICGVVAYYAVKGEVATIFNLSDLSKEQIAGYLVNTIIWIALKVAIALAILAILDYMYQRWKHEQDLRMTTEELREEFKATVGDPHVLQKRRQMRQEMAQQQRSVQGTKDADVVVTNPTHLSIALKFDPETMDVPMVVAKGADLIAMQIRKIALENHIPIIERKPLARALYETVEIGQPVQDNDQLIALAEILAYAYRLSGRNINEELLRHHKKTA